MTLTLGKEASGEICLETVKGKEENGRNKGKKHGKFAWTEHRELNERKVAGIHRQLNSLSYNGDTGLLEDSLRRRS